MKTSGVRIISVTLMLIIFGSVYAAYGESYRKIPPKIQAALFLKILAFNNDINKGGDITLYVISSPGFASEMKKSVGKKIGKSKMATISEGAALPSQKPSAIYIGESAKLDEVLSYTRSNQVLSITGFPGLVAKGVTLGLGSAGGRPKILLNVSASKDESINWSPAIYKISTIIK